MYIRFSAFDDGTQSGDFDKNDISLLLNGFNVGSWSVLQTERTSVDYSFVVTSDGHATLTNVVVTCPAPTLALSTSMICTSAAYVTT